MIIKFERNFYRLLNEMSSLWDKKAFIFFLILTRHTMNFSEWSENPTTVAKLGFLIVFLLEPSMARTERTFSISPARIALFYTYIHTYFEIKYAYIYIYQKLDRILGNLLPTRADSTFLPPCIPPSLLYLSYPFIEK